MHPSGGQALLCSTSHVPEKSGLPSAVRGTGADRFGLPSGVRGTPLVGWFHCAASGTAKITNIAERIFISRPCESDPTESDSTIVRRAAPRLRSTEPQPSYSCPLPASRLSEVLFLGA